MNADVTVAIRPERRDHRSPNGVAHDARVVQPSGQFRIRRDGRAIRLETEQALAELGPPMRRL
jgi:hypothetical protein